MKNRLLTLFLGGHLSVTFLKKTGKKCPSKNKKENSLTNTLNILYCLYKLTYGGIMSTKREQIVNDETGEVVYEKKSYIPELFNEEGYYFWNKKSQSRQFTGIELPLKSYEDKGIFCDLCRLYIADGSNLLEIGNRRRVRPFDVHDLAKMLGVSERQARRRLNIFLESGVLAKVTLDVAGKQEEWLVVNPLYFVASKRINDTLYKLFRNQLSQYLSPYANNEFCNRLKENENE